MLPSSAAHPDASRKMNGVVVAVLLATYSIEKSWAMMRHLEREHRNDGADHEDQDGRLQRSASLRRPRLTWIPVQASADGAAQRGEDGCEADGGVHESAP